MRIFRIVTFTIPILFFIIFPMLPASAIVPNDIDLVECTDIDQISLGECNALVALYEKMDGLEWNNDENWRKTDEPCDWYGITCDEDKRHIIGIRLEGKQGDHFGLKGALPAEIGDLVYLQKINFTYNDLTTLPPEIGKLQRLELLYLSHNYLERLPAEIGQLSSLTGIYLCFNELKTAPSEIGNLANLKNLYFDHNKLSEVPAEVGNLSNVEVVRFNHNELTALPVEIGNLSQLERLYINNNHLTALPSSFTALTNLERLDAGHNHLVYEMSSELEEWLSKYDSDWRNTQTYPPIEPTSTPMATATPVSGDPYEPDDSCRLARLLQVGASPQPHNFHQAQDEDWFQVDLQGGITYKLLASGISQDARPEIEIHTGCDASPVTSGPAFGNDNELIFTAGSSERHYIKIWNRDVNIFGQDVTYDVSISVGPTPTPTPTPNPSPSNDLAIIVTGHNNAFELQAHIFNAANRAYQVFFGAGIAKERIRYLGIEGDMRGDVDDDGKSDVDTYATVASVEEAISQWPLGKANSKSRIFIYLMSHGLEDYMMVDGDDDQLRAEVLDGWLDDLEAATGASVVVIYEACQSGSFITQPHSISKLGRVVITSTDAELNAYPVTRSGAQFSDAFFSALRWGKPFKEAFDIGRSASVTTLKLQEPQLDDNGDGQYTRSDGTLAETLSFPGYQSPSRPANVPALHSAQNIENDQGLIQVQASNAHYVKMVWADIYLRDHEVSDPNGSGVPPSSGADTIELSDIDRDGIYEGKYDNFSQAEDYIIVFYGHDMEDDSIMSTTFDVLNGLGNTSIRPNVVYLPVIID